MERLKIRRGFSYALRESEDNGEHENLLPDEEHADDSFRDIPRPPIPHAHLPVYATIHRYADSRLIKEAVSCLI